MSTNIVRALRSGNDFIIAGPDGILIANNLDSDKAARRVIELLDEHIKRLVAQEREECAKLCDDWPHGRDDVCEIAKAIRARGRT